MHAYYLVEDGDEAAPAMAGALSAEDLRREGVMYRALSPDPEARKAPLAALMAEQGYVQQDEVRLSPDTPGLDAICEKFVDEHRHLEDEVRFVLSGAGVFDIRDRRDRWMRVTVEPGDLIVVPKDRHHRFFLTAERSIHCVRLFQDASGWVPHYRAVADARPA